MHEDQEARSRGPTGRRPRAPRLTARPLSQGRAWGGSAPSPPPSTWDGAAPELHAASTPRGRPTPWGREAGTRRGQGRSITTCGAEQRGFRGGQPRRWGHRSAEPRHGREETPPGLGGRLPCPRCHGVNSAPPGEEELPAWPVLQLQSIFIMTLTVPDQGVSPCTLLVSVSLLPGGGRGGGGEPFQGALGALGFRKGLGPGRPSHLPILQAEVSVPLG